MAEYKPAVIPTRCQNCNLLVENCGCGENRVLPKMAADDFAFIKRRLEEIRNEEKRT